MGKGSKYRPVNRKRYESNYDRIFGKRENLKIILMTNKERAELIARDKKKMQSSYQEMCSVEF